MAITAADLQDMITHWLGCRTNGYLGSGYGSSVPDLLHTPLHGPGADAQIRKLRDDIAVMAQLSPDQLNIHYETAGVDKLNLYFEVAGNFIRLDDVAPFVRSVSPPEPVIPVVVPPYSCEVLPPFDVVAYAVTSASASGFSARLDSGAPILQCDSISLPAQQIIERSMTRRAVDSVSVRCKLNSKTNDDATSLWFFDNVAGGLIYVNPKRESFYDPAERLQFIIRQDSGSPYLTETIGAASLPIGVWFDIAINIAAGVMSYTVTEVAGAVFASGVIAGVFNPITVSAAKFTNDSTGPTSAVDYALSETQMCGLLV